MARSASSPMIFTQGDGRAIVGRALAACLALVVSALTVPGAAAQQPFQARCGLPPPPFAPTAVNRLKGEALQQRLSGKTMTFTRPVVGPAGRPLARANFRLEFRADGSTVATCRMRRIGGGGWQPCTTFGPDASGDRDVGTWRLDGDQIVLQRTRHGAEESRITLHAERNLLAARRIAAAPCLPGVVTLE